MPEKYTEKLQGMNFGVATEKTIWYDLQIPRGETFFLAGHYVDDKSKEKFKLKRDEWSIHFNISPDQQSFCGDGGDSSQVARAKNGYWIYHFTVKGDQLQSKKLVNMCRHHYRRLEPNVHFSPDGKWIIFRANFEGQNQIYAVEVEPFNE